MPASASFRRLTASFPCLPASFPCLIFIGDGVKVPQGN